MWCVHTPLHHVHAQGEEARRADREGRMPCGLSWLSLKPGKARDRQSKGICKRLVNPNSVSSGPLENPAHVDMK